MDCPPLYLASIIDGELQQIGCKVSERRLFAKALQVTLRNRTPTQGRVFHHISKNQRVVEVFNQFFGVWRSGETLESLIELLELLIIFGGIQRKCSPHVYHISFKKKNSSVQSQQILFYNIPLPGEGLDLTSTPKGFQCPPR